MIYLASPYSSGKSGMTMEERYKAVARKVSELMRKNMHVFSPIVHCHDLAKLFDLPKDYEFWQQQNKAWIDMCDTLWVLKLEGWEDSVGVQEEIKYAKSKGMVVIYEEV